MTRAADNTNACQQHNGNKGAIAFRLIGIKDIQSVMRLKTIANWNQTETDLRIFLKANPNGCFAAVHMGTVVGTAAVIKYPGGIAWISMVLVAPDFRRMGIASKLLEKCIENSSDCQTVKLDATPDGREVYKKLGFQDEYAIYRLAGTIASDVKQQKSTVIVKPLDESILGNLTRYDIPVFGADRTELLSSLLKNDSKHSFVCLNPQISGFCMGRPGTNFYQIGPVVADSLQNAVDLITAQAASLAAKPLVIDVPEFQPELLSWLENAGFHIQRQFIRMIKGKPAAQVHNSKVFSIAGPEFG